MAQRILDAISEQQLADYLQSVRAPSRTYTAVTLVDGHTVVANCGGWKHRNPTSGTRGWESISDSILILSRTDLFSPAPVQHTSCRRRVDSNTDVSVDDRPRTWKLGAVQ